MGQPLVLNYSYLLSTSETKTDIHNYKCNESKMCHSFVCAIIKNSSENIEGIHSLI